MKPNRNTKKWQERNLNEFPDFMFLKTHFTITWEVKEKKETRRVCEVAGKEAAVASFNSVPLLHLISQKGGWGEAKQATESVD